MLNLLLLFLSQSGSSAKNLLISDGTPTLVSLQYYIIDINCFILFALAYYFRRLFICITSFDICTFYALDVEPPT